jgi:hypothetical protein
MNDLTNDQSQDMSKDQAELAAVTEKMRDAMTPGFEVEVDPREAELLGAFTEDAISEVDAQESAVDLATQDDEGPVFLDEEGPSDIVPQGIYVTVRDES